MLEDVESGFGARCGTREIDAGGREGKEDDRYLANNAGLDKCMLTG